MLNIFNKVRDTLAGWKTLIFAALVAVGPDLLQFVAGLDWVQLGLSPHTAYLLATGIALMRVISNGPVGGAKP